MTLFAPAASSELLTQETTRRRQKPSLGLLYTLTFPIAASAVHLATFKIAGLSLSGWCWITMLVVGVGIFLSEAAILRNQRVHFPWMLWLPFTSFLWLSLTWVEGIARVNIQDACQITMPIFAGIVASSAVRSEADLKLLLRMFAINLGILILGCLIASTLPGSSLGDIPFRAGALTGLLTASVFIAAPKLRPYSWAGWGMTLALAALSGGRTATLAILGLPILRPQSGHVARKVIVLSLLAIGAVGMFHTKLFQERFFHDGGGNFNDIIEGRLNTSGRFETWPLIFDKALESPVIGHGAGSSGVYTDLISDLGGHPHNDYLRVFFETGLVGFTMFASVLLWQSLDIFRRIRANDGVVKHAFSAVWLGWLMFLFTSLTDNTLIYCAGYMNPLFALLGGAYSIHNRQRLASRESSEPNDNGEVP